MIRIGLPYHLRKLISVETEVLLEMEAKSPVVLGDVLDALERKYPVLRGTIRDHFTKVRRPFIRYFACREDYSHESMDFPLPPEVLAGREPFLIVGAIAGG